MSLNACFGAERNVFLEEEYNAKRIEVRSPILSARKFKILTEQIDPAYKPRSLT